MKQWSNPEIKYLNVNMTNEEEHENCPENNTRCFCEHYHPRLFFKKCSGTGGCASPGFKCKFTNKQPLFTKECSCTKTVVAPVS